MIERLPVVQFYVGLLKGSPKPQSENRGSKVDRQIPCQRKSLNFNLPPNTF